MKTGVIKCGSQRVTLSRMIFGASHLGSVQSVYESFKLLDMYYEAGGRTLETSRTSFDRVPFGASQSEKTIRDWMNVRGTAFEMKVITKGGHPDLRDMRLGRLDRKNLEHDIMTSLAVLNTDKVAGFLLHRDDTSMPVSEIMDVLDDIHSRGYADFIGVSNWTSERIAEANAYAKKKGQVQIAASSVLWNIGALGPENLQDSTQVYMSDSEYDSYKKSKIPVLAYSAQAVGYFSKHLSGKELQGPRTRAMDTEENRKRAARMAEVCAQYNVTPSAVCLAYIACNKLDAYPIFSCSNTRQMREAVHAFNLDIPEADFRYIIHG